MLSDLILGRDSLPSNVMNRNLQFFQSNSETLLGRLRLLIFFTGVEKNSCRPQHGRPVIKNRCCGDREKRTRIPYFSSSLPSPRARSSLGNRSTLPDKHNATRQTKQFNKGSGLGLSYQYHWSLPSTFTPTDLNTDRREKPIGHPWIC